MNCLFISLSYLSIKFSVLCCSISRVCFLKNVLGTLTFVLWYMLYILSVYQLSFDLIYCGVFLSWKRVLLQSNVSVFYWLWVLGIVKMSFLSARLKRNSSTFSSNTCMVSFFTFRSLIHLAFSIMKVWDIGLFSKWLPSSPNTLGVTLPSEATARVLLSKVGSQSSHQQRLS